MTAYDDTVKGPVPTPKEAWAKINQTAQQELKVKRVHPDAELPVYATDGSACFDLAAVHINGFTLAEHEILKRAGEHRDEILLKEGQAISVRTGLAFEVPPGHVLLIFSRSGHGRNNATRLSNCVGVIDGDYRGEVMVTIGRDSFDNTRPLVINPGDRIAQAMLVPIPRVKLVEVDELSETERGEGGFGSTGK